MVYLFKKDYVRKGGREVIMTSFTGMLMVGLW
jgi:hypothetical protein